VPEWPSHRDSAGTTRQSNVQEGQDAASPTSAVLAECPIPSAYADINKRNHITVKDTILANDTSLAEQPCCDSRQVDVEQAIWVAMIPGSMLTHPNTKLTPAQGEHLQGQPAVSMQPDTDAHNSTSVVHVRKHKLVDKHTTVDIKRCKSNVAISSSNITNSTNSLQKYNSR
jgi:hypothetical protein